MQIAMKEAFKGLKNVGEGPFGACIVKGSKVISVGNNRVVTDNDPTQHAEIVAIRRACFQLKTFNLKGCELYSTCEPCPMCFGAIYWARLDKLIYGCTRFEAAKIGFDDQLIYDELKKKELDRKLVTISKFARDKCKKLFENWENKKDRVEY